MEKSLKDIASTDANMKVQLALYDFENSCNIIPNRIIMGYKSLDELRNQFFDNIPIKCMEETPKEKELGVAYKYDGIPIMIDYNNPENLEVGYMSKWDESGEKYEKEKFMDK